MKSHVHKFRLECSIVNGHYHRLLGYAGSMLGLERLHFHFYYGVSSYMDHTHYFCGITGFPVKTENGHIHRMEGLLESNSRHEHKYKGYTSEDISYIGSSQIISFVR
ncbi:MAG: hypothetical protein GX279_01310 [Clostridiaceae bacterium]|nr:hypothetical protein [Clostridiaceae bacterium]